MEYLDPKTVALTVGQKEAQAWSEIQQFGKTSFMKWKAAGSQTFMAKEVLMNKLQGFLTIALGNPITAPLVDARELLQQVWDAGDVGKESPVLTEEAMQKQQSQPAPGPMDLEKLKGQIAEDAKHQAAEIEIVMRKMDDQSKKDIAELQGTIQILLQQMKNAGTQDLQTEQLQADAAHKIVDMAHEIDLTGQQAQIDSQQIDQQGAHQMLQQTAQQQAQQALQQQQADQAQQAQQTPTATPEPAETPQ